MVFYRELLKSAFDYLSIYYQKVLLVDLEHDRFTPVKVDDKEWDMVDKEITMSEWFRDFALSPYCHPYNQLEVLKFFDIERLKSLESPEALYYQKLIKGEYHNVLLEFIPIGDNRAYLMVKDLTKMLG